MGGGWSKTRPCRFTPGEGPGTHFIGGWEGPRAGLDGYGKSRLLHCSYWSIRSLWESSVVNVSCASSRNFLDKAHQLQILFADISIKLEHRSYYYSDFTWLDSIFLFVKLTCQTWTYCPYKNVCNRASHINSCLSMKWLLLLYVK
jgi:hypothetical protein